MGAIRWAPACVGGPARGIPGTDPEEKAHPSPGGDARAARPRGEALRKAREDGWEPGASPRQAPGGLPLSPGPGRDGHLAGLVPHLEGALGELGRLGRRGRLSREERATEEALRALLVASKASEDRAPRAGGDVPPGTRAPR